MLKRFLFWPYQVYAWLIFLPLAILASLLFGWLVVPAAWLISPRFANRYLARNWARILAFLIPMPVKVEGARNMEPSRSYVVVANHASMSDILALYGWLMLDLKWVIKKELRNVPAIGIGCEKAGHIFVDRQDPAAAKAAINRATGGLRGGVGILFFAEGTRSLDGRLLPFKKGAFRISMDHGLPVLPVTLLGTREVMPARTLKLFPGSARVVIHPPIEPTAASREGLERLMNDTRASIASALPLDSRNAD